MLLWGWAFYVFKFRYKVSLVSLNVPLLTRFTADPVEAGAKPSSMVLREAEFQLWQWVGSVALFHPFAFCFFLQYSLSYQA